MAVHAAFAEEMSGLQDRDDGFLTLFGQDSELDLAFLNVKNGLRDIALFEDFLVLVKVEYRFPIADFGEKDLGVKYVLGWFAHKGLLWPGRRLSNRGLREQPHLAVCGIIIGKAFLASAVQRMAFEPRLIP